MLGWQQCFSGSSYVVKLKGWLILFQLPIPSSVLETDVRPNYQEEMSKSSAGRKTIRRASSTIVPEATTDLSPC